MSEQPITSFTQLRAWQEAHRLAILVYQLTKLFPSEELYGLTSQIRRAVLSISSNIAEGFSRGTYKDKIRFYEIALGSLTEVQNQLLFARDIGCLSKEDFERAAVQTIEAGKLIRGLIKSSRGRIRNS